MDYTKVIPQIENSIAKIVALDLKTKQRDGSGTGFLFEKANIVVTCNHVVINPDYAYVLKFPDSEDYLTAKILLRDEEHDLALLGIQDSKREPLRVFDGEVKQGLQVIFSGYPLDMDNLTTHQGIISSISKEATGATTYLIDGTVNPGNSGCPLMSKDGQVIGVVNAYRREKIDILNKVENMYSGAISIQDVDLIDIYKALMSNLQLGIGYAIPASYIPNHKDIIETPQKNEDTKESIKEKGVKEK